MPPVTRQTPPTNYTQAKPAPKAAAKVIVKTPQPFKTFDKEASIFDAALPASQLAPTGHKFLIFGLSGTGKTTLACDFPKPLLLVRLEEVEDGSKSVRTVPGVHVTPPVIDPDQLSAVAEGQRRTSRYKSIVLDGVTRLQDSTVKKHLGLSDVPVQMTYGMVPQADWNLIGITLKEYLREILRLTDMGTHVIIVGGERDIKSEAKSEIAVPQVMVALTPSLTGWLHEVCDNNIHCFKRRALVEKVKEVDGKKQKVKSYEGKMTFCIHAGPGDLYNTKLRVPKGTPVPEEIEEPSFAKLDAILSGVPVKQS